MAEGCTTCPRGEGGQGTAGAQKRLCHVRVLPRLLCLRGHGRQAALRTTASQTPAWGRPELSLKGPTPPGALAALCDPRPARPLSAADGHRGWSTEAGTRRGGAGAGHQGCGRVRVPGRQPASRRPFVGCRGSSCSRASMHSDTTRLTAERPL